MCDDIDIEEHDILDNPTIKSIFPDISVIKEEIQSYFTDASNINQDNIINKTQKDVVVKETNLINPSNGKIESGHINNKQEKHITTLTQTGNESKDYSPVNSASTHFDNKPNFLHCNTIILGSKLNKTKNNECHDKHEKNLQAKVLVKDVGPSLNKSNKYCDKCLILFPNIHTMSIHRKNFHLQLNGFKSSNKNIISKNYESETQCKVCGVNFSIKGNLYRHYRNIHNISYKDKIKNEQIQNINKTQSQDLNKLEDLKKQVGSNNPCFHCQKTFLTQQSLIEHLYDVLQKPSKDSQKNLEKITIENNEVQNVHKSDKSFKKKEELIERYEHEEVLKSDSRKSHNMYRCSICSYYFFTEKHYLAHMTKKHRVMKQIKSKKVIFVSTCQLCSCSYSTVKSYNVHIHKAHKKELTQIFKSKHQHKFKKPAANKSKKVCKVSTPRNTNDKSNQVNRGENSKNCEINTSTSNMIVTKQPETTVDVFILKTTLFKCTKCDIHFLFSKVAMDHSSHIEMLVNWKCNICKKIFKKHDEPLHMKQHDYSDIFTVYGVSSITMILYHCSKCAVHFGEDNFLGHCLKCGLETPNSAYCNVCDILIDNDLKMKHDVIHKYENVKLTDFIIIKSDIDLESMPGTVKNQITKRNITESTKKLSQKKNRHCYTYCKTCKCFLNYPYQFVIHQQSRCAHIFKKLCKSCGLLFTLKSAVLHRRLHLKAKLKLKDFVFFDSSGKQIDPPIPDYPHCNVCKVHFISKLARNTHECRDEDHVTCHICKIKLSEAAYKLHMGFHDYSNKIHDSNVPSNTNKNSIILQNMTMENSNPKKRTCSEYYQYDILYSCLNCNVTLDTYDKVINHCQGHYNPEEKPIHIEVCKFCNLKFDSTCYKNHQKFHAKENSSPVENSMKILKFDILYFTSENDVWFNLLFVSLSDEQINRIVHKSIYKYERRLKMEITQDGLTDLTLYKCAKCQTIIDPSLLYPHAESICTEIKHYPCSVCNLLFICNELRVQHEQTHKRPNVTFKSYRIVVFNREEDKTYNNAIFSHGYLFYQCRNCDSVVDKSLLKNHKCNTNNLVKCLYCGLLFHVKDYDLHALKHKTLAYFTVENMKVILFGEKTKKRMIHDNIIKSTFSGKIYDYTFYRCKSCQICVKDAKYILKHICSVEANRTRCKECDLHFITDKLESHQELHKINPDFVKGNIQIISFDSSKYNTVTEVEEDYNGSTSNMNNGEKVKQTQSVFNDATQFDDIKENENICAKETSNDIVEKVTTIYKCNCGLHFLNEYSVTGHMKICGTKGRFHRQTCSKCGMIFTANDLFNHLLTHHGNKKQVYKFNIIEVSKEQAFNKSLYKCTKCNTNFSRHEDAKNHFNVCPNSERESSKWNIRSLLFDTSSTGSHEMDHKNGVGDYTIIDIDDESVGNNLHCNLTEQNDNNTANEIFEETDIVRPRSYKISKDKLLKLDLNKYDNTIYKCSKCNIHYLTKETVRKHVRNEKHSFVTKNGGVCNICGLKFLLPSLAKHIYVHHEQLNLKPTDIIVREYTNYYL